MTNIMVSRGSKLLLGGLVLAILALGFMPWHLARTTLDSKVLGAIQKHSGLEASAAPGVHLALLPMPRVVITDAVLTSADGALSAKIPRLRADVRILPLLGGHIELDTLDLAGPQITLQAQAGPAPGQGWPAPLSRLLDANRASPRLVIRQGNLFLRNALSTVSVVRDINMVVGYREEGDALRAAGSLVWRGELAELNGEWPITARDKATSAGMTSTKAVRQKALFSIKSRLLNASFSGDVMPDSSITGPLELETLGFGAALAQIGESGLLAALAEKLKISGTVTWTGQELTAPTLYVSLDGDRLEGAMSLRPAMAGHAQGNGQGNAAARWALSGTFAGTQLDLDRIIRRAGPQRYVTTGDKASQPLELATITQGNVDLRLSVDSALLGQTRMANIALQFMSTHEKIDINLVQALAYKGSLKARLALNSLPTITGQINGIELKLAGNFEKIDMASAMAEMAESKRFAGMGFGQWSAEGSGLTLAEAFGALKGRASFLVRQGEISGIALGDIARRAERPLPASTRELRGGRTQFEQASFSGPITQSVLELTEAQASGTGFRVNMTGKIDVLQRQFDLAGQLGTAAATQAASGTASPLAFEFTGPWNDPQLVFEPEADMQRKGSKAPSPTVQ